MDMLWHAATVIGESCALNHDVSMSMFKFEKVAMIIIGEPSGVSEFYV